MSHNPVFHARTKHNEIDYTFMIFIREKATSGAIDICYIPSAKQIADVFTKAIAEILF